MTERRALTSGLVLVERYELQDLVSDRLGAVTWRALDLVLNRNVGIELIRSDDPRAPHFLEAARQSTAITDARFLRVLDILENEHGHHVVIREWAKAFGLDQLLAQSPLPNHRAAQIVAEVAEALAHAHEHGQYHRRLAPHHVLVKESGAVRIVGLGLASALDAPHHAETRSDRVEHEAADVTGIGKLLYACLVSRWPGEEVDHLPAAPTEHGRLLRPRQVRAGVGRNVDAVCARILADYVAPPKPERLSSAESVAHALRLVGNDAPTPRGPKTAVIDSTRSSPDLFRSDPIREPSGPVPGLTAARRPKAYDPPPPTRYERAQAMAADATRDDRRFVLAGVGGALVLALVIGILAFRSSGVEFNPFNDDDETRSLPIASVQDFDPLGDGRENAGSVGLAIDGDTSTGWQTSTYYNQPTLGGLKDGVGLVLDLQRSRKVAQVRITFTGEPTSVDVLGNGSGTRPPESLAGLTKLGGRAHAGETATINLTGDKATRYLVIWLTSLPEIADTRFRGEIREVVVRGAV
jgi:putative peptidoglycan lipid II flippase